MPIRLGGLQSGMDTDAMVKDLVKASSGKKDKLVKQQTLLKWRQEAWAAMNTKISTFFKKHTGNMRYEGAYNRKATTVSNPNIAKVIAGEGAAIGTQTLTVDQLAKAGSLTGGRLSEDGKFKTDSTMKDLGALADGETASIQVTVGSKSTNITMGSSTTIKDVVDQMKAAGVEASFDAGNQRFFINAKTSGSKNDFSISANDAKGIDALSSMGLLTNEGIAGNPEYAKWAAFKYNSVSGAYDNSEATIIGNMSTEISSEVSNRLANINKEIGNLKTSITDLQNRKVKEQEKYDKLKGTPEYTDAMNTAGNTVQDKIDTLKAQLESSTATEDDKKAIQKKLDTLDSVEIYEANLKDFDTTLGTMGTMLTDREKIVQDNIDFPDDRTKNTLLDNVTKDLLTKVDTAVNMVTNGGSIITGPSLTAKRINGEDGKITLNGAEFTSGSNTFNVNGLSITAKELTGTTPVSVNTDFDAEAVYDDIKNFYDEFNKLMLEMGTIVNAPSIKGYEPLTDEEKATMSSDQVAQWEKKIKDSLFRRDDDVNNIMNILKDSMAKPVTVNGKKLFLSDFGINTQSYLDAAPETRGTYHIDGNSEDSVSSGNKDKLKSAISNNPEEVGKFFSGLITGLYDELNAETTFIPETRSYGNVYDDKSMQREYDEYSKKIKTQEERIKRLEDKYYRQFTAMEKAMATLNSTQSSFASMLGS